MTYSKPKIGLLGDAARVIQFGVQKGHMSIDANPQKPNTATASAYDLDE